MAQIILVNANEHVQDAVLWQVYHLLAQQAANPHEIAVGNGQLQDCNAAQPVAFTQGGYPSKFRALLSIQESRVGIFCVTHNMPTLLNALVGFAHNEIVVCGVRTNEDTEAFWRAGLETLHYEHVEIRPLGENIIYPQDAELRHDARLFNEQAQNIANLVMQMIQNH